jgi:hypothetical protein
MPSDYEVVLSLIVYLTDQEEGRTSTSLTHLAHRLSCDPDSIAETVRKLEKEEYVHVDEPNPRVFLIQPTLKGIEKVTEWKTKKRTESPGGRFLSAVKHTVVVLFGLLVGFLLWWLGLSPDQLEPLSSRVPFKVYDQWASVILEENGRLSYEALKVSPRSDEITNPNGSIAATLDGRIALSFDVESVARNHQVNIESIHVEIVHQAPPEVTDILEIIHGRGGGATWDYEVR